jgi:hypothetical protein
MRATTATLAAGAATIAAASALASGMATPILTGPNPPYGKGFGQVKPRTIYLGGDISGEVCRIHWLTWGRPVAIGQGIAWYIGPRQATYQGHAAPALIALSRLGTYRGRPAYRRYEWWFPNHGAGFGRIAACR